MCGLNHQEFGRPRMKRGELPTTQQHPKMPTVCLVHNQNRPHRRHTSPNPSNPDITP